MFLWPKWAPRVFVPKMGAACFCNRFLFPKRAPPVFAPEGFVPKVGAACFCTQSGRRVLPYPKWAPRFLYPKWGPHGPNVVPNCNRDPHGGEVVSCQHHGNNLPHSPSAFWLTMKQPRTSPNHPTSQQFLNSSFGLQNVPLTLASPPHKYF